MQIKLSALLFAGLFMKVSRKFSFDAAHRLMQHTGKCKHLHGHTYHLWVELEGELDENGMVFDFGDIKSGMNAIVDECDHTVLLWEMDTQLIDCFSSMGLRMKILPFETTAENLCVWFLEQYKAKQIVQLKKQGICKLIFRLKETESSEVYIESFI